MIVFFTNGSKINSGAEKGFYSVALQKREFFRLPKAHSVFQSEILAIEKEIEKLLFPISEDIQDALKPIGSNTIKSKVIIKRRNVLNVISHHKLEKIDKKIREMIRKF